MMRTYLRAFFVIKVLSSEKNLVVSGEVAGIKVYKFLL